ncbi:hypothetical protein CLOM621_07604 [Clostridium sp. M62/1]|nr:hypothetical protein CLOM621_07604 [Clostridium sp. M62/1]
MRYSFLGLGDCPEEQKIIHISKIHSFMKRAVGFPAALFMAGS